jgi:hypothetical protein
MFTSFLLYALYAPPLIIGADDSTELYACAFAGHTPAGTVAGWCTTQSQPGPEYVSRWTLTLTFDEQSLPVATRIKSDKFYDMVRSQCLDDGSFTVMIPLWGDFQISPFDQDYVGDNKGCYPVYQVVPSSITLSQINAPALTLQLVFEQRPSDYVTVTGLPTEQWTIQYLQSFRRLQLNAQYASPPDQIRSPVSPHRQFTIPPVRR